jgi:hypothetical protein
VTAGWTKLHNEEFHNLHSSPSIIRMTKSRRMRWAGHAEIAEGKRPLRRPRHRWVLVIIVLIIYTEKYCPLEV